MVALVRRSQTSLQFILRLTCRSVQISWQSIQYDKIFQSGPKDQKNHIMFLVVYDFNHWNTFLWSNGLTSSRQHPTLASSLTSLLRGFTGFIVHEKQFYTTCHCVIRGCSAMHWFVVQNARPFASFPKHRIAKAEAWSIDCTVCLQVWILCLYNIINRRLWCQALISFTVPLQVCILSRITYHQ